MKTLVLALLATLASLGMTGCTEQELIATKGRPEPVIIIVE